MRSLLDAPCGDCNWMSYVNLGGIHYTGVDNDIDHVRKAREKAPHLEVICLDIFSDLLPKCDAVLCRDFLQHMPYVDAVRAIAQFQQTGAKWLLATSFRDDDNRDIEDRGDFRRLNLEIAPFWLGPPIEQIDDPPGSGRILGVWRSQ